MQTKFKTFIPFPSVNLPVINKILTGAGLSVIQVSDLTSVEAFFSLLNQLESLCGVSEASIEKTRERKRSRAKQGTRTIIYKALDLKERKLKLHKSMHHHRNYNRALVQAGKLRGRLEVFFGAYMSALCIRLDKSGFATVYTSKRDVSVINNGTGDILTNIFLSLTASLNSVRKAFTLDSQMQGGMNPVQLYLLSVLESGEQVKKTRWDLIASIHPVSSIFARVEEPIRMHMLAEAFRYQILMAKFLEKQWALGVSQCAAKKMMVPRRGTTKVDSSGWNSASGAWNNMLRFIKSICFSSSIQTPVITKCMKLTAADQMKWAEMEGKEEEKNVPVFCELALEKNITPWGIVLNKCVVSEQVVKEVCQKHGADPKKWLEGPIEQFKVGMKQHHDMICGCVVESSIVVQQMLKSLGAFGYRANK